MGEQPLNSRTGMRKRDKSGILIGAHLNTRDLDLKDKRREEKHKNDAHCSQSCVTAYGMMRKKR